MEKKKRGKQREGERDRESKRERGGGSGGRRATSVMTDSGESQHTTNWGLPQVKPTRLEDAHK